MNTMKDWFVAHNFVVDKNPIRDRSNRHDWYARCYIPAKHPTEELIVHTFYIYPYRSLAPQSVDSVKIAMDGTMIMNERYWWEFEAFYIPFSVFRTNCEVLFDTIEKIYDVINETTLKTLTPDKLKAPQIDEREDYYAEYLYPSRKR